MSDDDAAIAEFHAAARRRQVRIFAITSVLCLALGIVILLVTFTAGAAPEGGARYEVKTLIFGIGFLVAGGGAALTAWRVRRGEDVD
jgi:hypothetical protein